jgi:hypothetical protein
MTKRKLITIQESCSGCVFLKVKYNSTIQWHCDKLDVSTRFFSSGESMYEPNKTLKEWFENLCPLEEIK